MMKAIAIDDEPVALGIIERHAKQVPFIDLEAVFSSANEALSYMKKAEIDLVFLDIAMPDLSGLEFATIVKQRIQVVFTTAYSEHALKGFDLAATDYLLKPINFSRFLQACRLAEERRTSKRANEAPPEQERSLFVKDGYNWVHIRLDDLLYVRGEDNYVRLCEAGRQILTRMTLAELQERLPSDQFARIHKSFIVALFKIEKVEKHQVTIGGVSLPLSRPYRQQLFRTLRL